MGSGGAEAENGTASWCLNGVTYLTSGCLTTTNNVCGSGGLSLTPSQSGEWDTQTWAVSTYKAIAPQFPPGEIPYGSGQFFETPTFGASNEPDCSFHVKDVTTVADIYTLAAAGATTVQAPGVLENDILPYDCMPLGE
jgi:hypothetical protein